MTLAKNKKRLSIDIDRAQYEILRKKGVNITAICRNAIWKYVQENYEIKIDA